MKSPIVTVSLDRLQVRHKWEMSVERESDQNMSIKARNIVQSLGAIVITLVLAAAAYADIAGIYGSNTTLSDGDTWTDGNVTINNGATVDIPLGATVSFNSTLNRNLAGTSGGVFLNSGTFQHATATSGDNIYLSGPVKFDNQGTFEFVTGGDLAVQHVGSVFENTGLIHKSGSGGGNEPSFIFQPSLSSSGDFFNNGGTIQVDAGRLEIIGGHSNGGTFTTNGSGRIQFSGNWTELRGTATGSSNVHLRSESATSGNKFAAKAATTVVDVGGNGVTWVDDAIDTSGNVLQNDGLFKIALAATQSLTGGGTLLNSSSGTLDVQKGIVNLSGGTAFENEGAMTFTTSDTKGFQGSGTVRNKSGATAEWQDGTINLNAAGVTLKNEGTFNLTTTATKTLSGTGTFENASGATMNWQAGQLTLNNDFANEGTFNLSTSDAKTLSGTGTFENAFGATMDWQAGQLTLNNDLTNKGTFNLSTTATKTLGTGTGTLENASGATMDWQAGQLTLNNDLTNKGTFNLSTTATKTLSGTSTFENASGATMNWQAGPLTLNNDLTNNGTFNFAQSTANLNLGGTADFVNNHVFNHNLTGGGDNIRTTGSGSFLNNGLFEFGNNGDIELIENYTFVNNGTVLKSGGTGNETHIFDFGDGNGIGGTFDNQGTVRVEAGEIQFHAPGTSGYDDIVVPQVSGTTLTGGTWIADASSSGLAIIDLQPAKTGIATIGADATVKLIGAGATFSQINNVTTVDGAFYVNGSRSFSLASGFTVSSTGTLGGDGTFVGDADIPGILAPGDEGSSGILTFQSTVDLTDGTFQVDIDGLVAGSGYDQLAFAGTGPHELILSNTTLDLDVTLPTAIGQQFVIIDGFDTLTGIFAGLPNESSFVQDGVGFSITYNPDNITLNVVPEPSVLLLLMVGSLMLGARTLLVRRRER